MPSMPDKMEFVLRNDQHPMHLDPEIGWMCLRHGGCEPALALREWAADGAPSYGAAAATRQRNVVSPDELRNEYGGDPEHLLSDHGAPEMPGMGEQVGPLAEEWNQEGRIQEDNVNSEAYRLCKEFLGLPMDENPAELVAYHAQARLFLLALMLMRDRGIQYGQGFESAGWAGNLMDVKKKYERLWHVGWTNWKWAQNLGGHVRPPHEDPLFREAYLALDQNAMDLLNHTGFFLQCLHSNNRLGR